MKKLNGLGEVCEFIREKDDFVIVNHLDADGLSAAGILATMFQRAGKKYSVKTMKQLDREKILQLRDFGKTFVFADLGSGQLDVLNKEFGDKEYCIIDHHRPFGETDRPQINAHLSGYDGTSDISGASTAYFVAREIDGKNIDLSKLAVVGSVGDMQDSRGALESLNRVCLEDGAKCGEVTTKKDIRLFGRHSRPLTEFIMYSSDPYLPGLFGNEDACRNFIQALNIKLFDGKAWRYYCDLSEDEKKKLISALYVYGKQQNIPEESLKTLVGEVYEFPNEAHRSVLRDAKEFATLLNACGRHKSEEIALKVCLGDRGDGLREANNLLQKHRRMLREGIEWCRKNPPIEMSSIYVVDAEKIIDENILGVIMGMLYSMPGIGRNKPIVGLAIDDGGALKVSARANWSLVRVGLDLGSAIHEICEEMGFAGGGHKIAAGARLTSEGKEEFLEKLDEIVGKQLKQQNTK